MTTPGLNLQALGQHTTDEDLQDLTTQMVRLMPCGHTVKEATAIQLFARDRLCPVDQQTCTHWVSNRSIRHLAEELSTAPPESTEKVEVQFPQNPLRAAVRRCGRAFRGSLRAVGRRCGQAFRDSLPMSSLFTRAASQTRTRTMEVATAIWRRAHARRIQEIYEKTIRVVFRVEKVSEGYQDQGLMTMIRDWQMLSEHKLTDAISLEGVDSFSAQQFLSCREICQEILNHSSSFASRRTLSAVNIPDVAVDQMEIFLCKNATQQAVGVMVTATHPDFIQIQYLVTHPNHLNSPMNLVSGKESGVGRCLIQYAEYFLARPQNKPQLRVPVLRTSSDPFFAHMGFEEIGSASGSYKVLEKSCQSDDTEGEWIQRPGSHDTPAEQGA